MTQAGVSERRLASVGELTAELLAELRRIAQAATPGPWTSPWEQKDGLDPEEYGFYGASGDKIVGLLWYDGWHLECSEENARHIATFDPPTVLVLLDEIERLRRAVEAATRMAEILRGLEWSGWDERFRAHMCPVCGGYKSKNKHFPDCDLNKALSFLRDIGRDRRGGEGSADRRTGAHR